MIIKIYEVHDKNGPSLEPWFITEKIDHGNGAEWEVIKEHPEVYSSQEAAIFTARLMKKFRESGNTIPVDLVVRNHDGTFKVRERL